MSPFDWQALVVSLRTVSLALIITCFIAIPLALWRLRTRQHWAIIVDVLMLLPVLLPPTITGMILLNIFGAQTALGKFLEVSGMALVFSWPATVMTATLAGLPLMYLATRAAFEQVDRGILDAAKMDGCGKTALLLRVLLPAAWPGVASGALLAFTRSLGEFGATLMFAGNIPGQTQTLPIALYFHVEAGDDVAAWKLAILLSLLSLFAALILARRTHH